MNVFVSHQQSMRAKNETFKNISTRHLKDVADMLVLFQLIFEWRDSPQSILCHDLLLYPEKTSKISQKILKLVGFTPIFKK